MRAIAMEAWRLAELELAATKQQKQITLFFLKNLKWDISPTYQELRINDIR